MRLKHILGISEIMREFKNDAPTPHLVITTNENGEWGEWVNDRFDETTKEDRQEMERDLDRPTTDQALREQRGNPQLEENKLLDNPPESDQPQLLYGIATNKPQLNKIIS